MSQTKQLFCLRYSLFSDSKDLVKRTISDNILKDKAYEISRNCKHDEYQIALARTIYTLIGSRINVNEQLAKELQKPVIKKKKIGKVYARFKGNIWAADLAKMGSFNG